MDTYHRKGGVAVRVEQVGRRVQAGLLQLAPLLLHVLPVHICSPVRLVCVNEKGATEQRQEAHKNLCVPMVIGSVRVKSGLLAGGGGVSISRHFQVVCVNARASPMRFSFS